MAQGAEIAPEVEDLSSRSGAALVQWLTIAHAALEGTAALYAAWLAGSVALLSFGLDSLVEVTSAAIVLWRVASLHKRSRIVLTERAGLQVVGICFAGLALVVAMEGIQRLVHREPPSESLLGIIIAVVSVLAMPFLATAKRAISRRINSEAMRADARQTDFCFLLALILLLGLAAYRVLGWWWIDAVAALAMVPIIFWEALRAFRGQACACS